MSHLAYQLSIPSRIIPVEVVIIISFYLMDFQFHQGLSKLLVVYLYKHICFQFHQGLSCERKEGKNTKNQALSIPSRIIRIGKGGQIFSHTKLSIPSRIIYLLAGVLFMLGIIAYLSIPSRIISTLWLFEWTRKIAVAFNSIKDYQFYYLRG